MNAHVRDLVERFFQSVAAGELPDDLVTEDMGAWVMRSGDIGKEKFALGAKLLSRVFEGSLVYTIDTLVAGDDRAVAEVRSSGRLMNGEDFNNVNVFIFRIEGGRVSEVREYMDPMVVNEKLAPLIEKIIASLTAQG